VDVLIGSKCHSGRSELGRNVQAALAAAGEKATITAVQMESPS
jgi:hypothetical protein